MDETADKYPRFFAHLRTMERRQQDVAARIGVANKTLYRIYSGGIPTTIVKIGMADPDALRALADDFECAQREAA